MHFIETATASTTTSLQLTSFPSTYNSIYINCTGLGATTTYTYMAGYVGEGSTTWKTTNANYMVSGFQVNNGAFGGTCTGTGGAGAALCGSDYMAETTTNPTSIKLYIDEPGSSTAYKMISSVQSEYDLNGSGVASQYFTNSWWLGDTGAITGFELVGLGGASGTTPETFSGTCSAYGMN